MFLRFLVAVLGVLLLIGGITFLWHGAWIVGVIAIGLAVVVAEQVMHP